jgi:hypothetical protein
MELNYTNTNTTSMANKTLTIWQQNMNKSCICQHDLISSTNLARRGGIDIVALQEPSINAFGNTIASRDWVPIYPSTHSNDTSKTRSLLLVRSKILTEKWKQVDFPSGDVTVIQLNGPWGALTIYNIYNDCENNNTIHKLEDFNHRHEADPRRSPTETKHVIWLGDFNRHHPHWDNPEDTRLFTRPAISNAEILISAIAKGGLDMALPPGIPMHIHNVTKKWTRLDNVFILEDALESILACEALSEAQGINTDHLPILTTLNLDLARAPSSEPKNYRNVDREQFDKALDARLDLLPPPRKIHSQSELSDACNALTSSIQEVINCKVPTLDLGVKAKCWWTKGISKLRRDANKKGRTASKYKNWPEHHSHKEHRTANQTFQRMLEKTKCQHWRDWLEKAEDPDIWTAHKYTANPAGDRGKSRIPVLKLTSEGTETLATTNAEKSDMLAKTFFPPKPPQTTPLHFVYPKPACIYNPISKAQICRHLAKLKPYKAPGSDGIPNIVLMKCANTITNRLYLIYTAITEKGFYHTPWKISTMVVLRKPGKPRYDTPKAYRPIALLNTMGKVLTAIVAEILVFYTETLGLLPAHHFSGRPGRTTTDAVHLLTYKIKDAWRKRQVTAVLFLDIEGAFPNAVTSKLLHRLKKIGIPQEIITFVKTMLDDRSTILRFDNHTSDPLQLDNGIGQGDPLSMALHQFYNADILEIPRESYEAAEAYVDDAILIATAKTFTEAHAILDDMMTRPNGMIEWSKSHNSPIEYSKLALIDFAHHSMKKTCPPFNLQGTVLDPGPTAKYLGIILDQHLNWGPQLASVHGKGTKWTSQIKRLTRPLWGLTPKGARKLYTSVALPRVLYGIDVWCTPIHEGMRKEVERAQSTISES